MAVTNSGMTLYIHNDSDVGWLGEDGTSNEVFWQGTGSQMWIVSKTAVETASLTLAADLSAAKYFSFAMLSTISPFYNTIKIQMQVDASNYEEYLLADRTVSSGTYRAIAGEFKYSTVIMEFGLGTETGTYLTNRANHAGLDITVDNTTSGNIRSVENHYIDAMYYGSGRTIGGTTTGDELFKESNDLDMSSDTYDCCMLEFRGKIFSQVDVTITTTTGNSYGETIVFSLANNTSNAYLLTITGTADFQGTNVEAENGATVAIDTTGATSFDMAGGTIKNALSVAFITGQEIAGVVITDSGEVDTNGATMSGTTITDTTETVTGSIVVNSSAEASTVTGMQFKAFSNNSRYAVYVPASVTAFTMSNWTFDDYNNTTGYALYWAGTSGTLTISSTSGTNLITAGCTAASGGTVVVSASFDHTLEGLELNTEITYVTADTTTVLFHVETATTSDGNGKYKTTYTHAGGASVDILIHHVDYQPDISNIYGLTLPSADATVKVQMFWDDNQI